MHFIGLFSFFTVFIPIPHFLFRIYFIHFIYFTIIFFCFVLKNYEKKFFLSYLITRKNKNKRNYIFRIVENVKNVRNACEQKFLFLFKNRRFDNRRKEKKMGMKSKVLLIACQVLRFFLIFFSQEYKKKV